MIDASLIIPLFNEEENIDNLFDMICNQSILPREIIFVNSNSTDRTSEKLKNNVKNDEKLNKLFLSLKEINSKLWVIEDDKRMCEKNSDFSEKFVELSRNIHFLNDKRAKIKLEINQITGSKIREVKEYTAY